MFINSGARNLLMQGERQKFLDEEWPRIQATIQRLGLDAKELLDSGVNGKRAENPHFSQNRGEVGHPSSKETLAPSKDDEEER